MFGPNWDWRTFDAERDMVKVDAALGPVLDERSRRLWAGAEARAIGQGGISRVAEATGLSRITIRSGLSELHPGCQT